MGCDIHIQVEIRTPDGWNEVSLSTPGWPGWQNRSYGTFEFLAGVRDGRLDNFKEADQVLGRRGFPDDGVASEDFGGEHSFTWGSMAELQAAPWEKYGLGDSGFCEWVNGEEIANLVAKVGLDNVRVLIGFDS